jgi:hypothetical protein
MKKLVLAASLAAFMVPAAWAGQGAINGFATLGAAGSSESNVRYGADGTMTKGADFVGESKLGVQADYVINKVWSLTAQAVAKSMMDDRERIGVTGEWLFASYHVNDATSVRFGKLRLPLFMYSEQLDVGKAYAIARLPVEMYGVTPTNAYHGVDALIKFEVGDDGELLLQPYVGITRFEGRTSMSAQLAGAVNTQMFGGAPIYTAGQQAYNTFEANSIKGLNVQYTGLDGHLKLRAGYLATNLKDADGMTVMMSNLNFGYGPSVGTAGYSANNVDAGFASLGAQYRVGHTTVTAEYGRRRVDSASFAQTDGYYLMLDHKIDQFVPYISYAAIDSDKNKMIKGTKAAVSQQNTLALGLGYALSPLSNIKGEVSQVSVGKDNNFNYFVADSATGNAINDKTFNVYRLSYNLLF